MPSVPRRLEDDLPRWVAYLPLPLRFARETYGTATRIVAPPPFPRRHLGSIVVGADAAHGCADSHILPDTRQPLFRAAVAAWNAKDQRDDHARSGTHSAALWELPRNRGKNRRTKRLEVRLIV
jgi:hypothetical protein